MIEANPPLPAAERLKRARMRAWRRGMREMDLIMGGFIDAEGAALDAASFDAFESLLGRRDADLYAWVAGRDGAEPDDASALERALIERMRATARTVATR